MELATLVTNRQSSFPASIQQTNHQNTLANWSNYEYERLNLQCLINYLYSPVQNCLPDNPKKKKNQNFKFGLAVNKSNNKKEREFLRDKEREWQDLKFSAVLGAISAKSSILIRPAGMLPMVMSKKTIGFFGFGGLTCHSTPDPVFPAIDR